MIAVALVSPAWSVVAAGFPEWYPNPGSDPLDPASPVPEPDALLLHVSGLLALAGLRRRS